MDQDQREVDIRAFSHKVTTCIKSIKEFIGKLDSCDERMSLEGMDDHEQLLLSDSLVIETALDCSGDLECFQKTLQEMLAPPQTSSPYSLTMMESVKYKIRSNSLVYVNIQIFNLALLNYQNLKFQYSAETK